MLVHDYNGSGKWSRSALIERYHQYAGRLGVTTPRDVQPKEHRERDAQWVYPVMDRVIEGIEAGDRACIELGVEFIEEAGGFPFGRILKANTARALRRAQLTGEQSQRVRARVIGMLAGEKLPREYRQYARLLRRVGVQRSVEEIEATANRSNPYVERYLQYFAECIASEASRRSRPAPPAGE
jgi:hypothetical protein